MTQRWMKISATALYGASSTTICGQRQRIAPKTAPNSHQCTQILTVQTKLRYCKLYAGPGASLVAGGESGLVVGVCGVGGRVEGDGGLGGGDAHRSGAGGELHAIGAAVAAWVQ